MACYRKRSELAIQRTFSSQGPPAITLTSTADRMGGPRYPPLSDHHAENFSHDFPFPMSFVGNESARANSDSSSNSHGSRRGGSHASSGPPPASTSSSAGQIDLGRSRPFRDPQAPGRGGLFFERLEKSWQIHAPVSFHSLNNPSQVRRGEVTRDGGRVQEPYEQAASSRLDSRLEMVVPVSPPEAFYRVLEVMEFVEKLGVRFVGGNLQPDDTGSNLKLVINMTDAVGQPVSDEVGSAIKAILSGWPFTRDVGKLYMKHKNRVPILDIISKAELTAVTVAGKDDVGVLRKICSKLHDEGLDIAAMMLRTQGKDRLNARFASVFYVKPVYPYMSKTNEAAALHGVKAELEGKGHAAEDNLEVSYSERVAAPEMWLNFELSRRANTDPGVTLPADVGLDFIPGLIPGTWQMKLVCNDSPHVIFDTLSTLHFRGYRIVRGSFHVAFDLALNKRRVSQTYLLKFPNSAEPIQRPHLDDIKGQLALTFCRRQTKGEGVELAASNKPGLLYGVSKLFHEEWWSITRADVEIMTDTAKTVLYAEPAIREKCPPMSALIENLEEEGFKIGVPSHHPDGTIRWHRGGRM